MKSSWRSLFNPRKWGVMTWALFVPWLLLAAFGNAPIPLLIDGFPEPELPNPPLNSDPTLFATMSYTYLIGLPLTHTQVHFDPQVPPPVWETNWWTVVVDLALIALVQAAIVVVGQLWLRRFSLRTVFLLTALVAGVMVVGRFVSAQESFYAMMAYAYTVYFSPVLTVAAAAVLAVVRRRVRPAA